LHRAGVTPIFFEGLHMSNIFISFEYVQKAHNPHNDKKP